MMRMIRTWDLSHSNRQRYFGVDWMIAKTPDAKTNWETNSLIKLPKRKYRALVSGMWSRDEGTIIGNIARNPKDRECRWL